MIALSLNMKLNKKGMEESLVNVIVWIAFFILIMSTVIYYILRNVAA
jgi:hypothetical protein